VLLVVDSLENDLFTVSVPSGYNFLWYIASTFSRKSLDSDSMAVLWEVLLGLNRSSFLMAADKVFAAVTNCSSLEIDGSWKVLSLDYWKVSAVMIPFVFGT